MKRITAFIASIALYPMVWGEISPVYAQASCQATVDAVAREIRKKGTSVLITGESAPLSNDLDNSVRINSLKFGMAFKPNESQRSLYVAENIENSLVLLKSYAARIFANCSGTGYVGFGVTWGERFGMTDGGILTYDFCTGDRSQITNNLSNIVDIASGGGYCAYVIPDF